MQARRKERWDLHQSRAIEAALAGASDPDSSSPAWSKLDLSSLEKLSPDLLKQAQALMASQEEHHGKKEREERAKLLQDLEEHYKDMGMSKTFQHVHWIWQGTHICQKCAACSQMGHNLLTTCVSLWSLSCSFVSS